MIQILIHDNLTVRGEQVGEGYWSNGVEFATVRPVEIRQFSSGKPWNPYKGKEKTFHGPRTR